MKYTLALSLLLVSAFAHSGQVDNYSIRHYSTIGSTEECIGSNSTLASVAQLPFFAVADVCRTITLYSHNSQKVALLVFYRDDASLAGRSYYQTTSDSSWEGGYFTSIAYRISEYDDVIDLLRNETPVVVYVKTSSQGKSTIHLGTGSFEAIGEAE